MISIVTWLWAEGFRDYGPEHVNALGRMLARRVSVPHRFICIADKVDGFEAHVEVLRTPAAAVEVGKLRSPEGVRFPSCYRRLWAFSEDARILGERILVLDLDTVAIRDLAPIAEYSSEPFVGWRPRMTWGNGQRIGGGMYLLTTGSRRFVWDCFKGEASIAEARAARYRGSDQAWLSYCLGTGETYWPDNAGIYSIRDIKDGRLPLPKDARLVHFNGPQKPWNSPLPWVREHWQ